MVIYRTIKNDNGSIQLWDLLSEVTGDYYGEPALEFPEAKYQRLWDNEEYLLWFFRGIKKRKKKATHDLKMFCDDNQFDYKSTRKDLLKIYKLSKKYKWWR